MHPRRRRGRESRQQFPSTKREDLEDTRQQIKDHYPKEQIDVHKGELIVSKKQPNSMNGTTRSPQEAEDRLAKPIPTLAFSGLKIGRALGKGGFSVVSDVQGIRLDDVYDTSEDESDIRRDF